MLKSDNPFETPLDSHASSPLHNESLGGQSAPSGQPALAGPAPEAQQPSKHKTACFFHLAFKAAALATYLFCTLFSDNFVLIFVAVVLLLAVDFWTVKNITGRVLVGLRWWNDVTDDGTRWVFESKPANRTINASDSYVFWAGIYGAPLVWGLFAFTALLGLHFQWLLIVIVAMVLSCANVVGFWKCQKDSKQKIQSFLQAKVIQSATGISV